MTQVIGVLTTRAGQTSTSWATSVAWTLAESRSALLVDCDMEGGTIADLLYLNLDERTIANCFGDRSVAASELAQQAVDVPNRPGLKVVPGLHGTYGPDMIECLRRLGPAIRGQEADVVIVDLGQPLGHPGMRSARATADAIAAWFQRIFIVIRDDPALLMRSVDVLRTAQLPHGDVVICEQRSKAHRRLVDATFERELPDLRVRHCWSWDERRAVRTSESGRPMPMAAIDRELQL